MIVIGDILVSDAVVDTHFVCELNACKGACCWEGDWGAPLEEAERETLEHIYPDVAPFLSEAGKAIIARDGTSTYFEGMGGYGTPLLADGACAYLTRNAAGISLCGIEQAWRAGAIDYQKPISCHLYPIRVKSRPEVGFEALNYDEWDICSAACSHGEKQQVRLFEFAKAALVRKYGEAFYEELVAAAEQEDAA